MTQRLAVHVNRAESTAAVTRDEVERAVRAVAETEGVVEGEISVTFLDAPTIAALNETHLEQKGPTDVIAFNLNQPRAPLGDVYVCPEIARRSAEEWEVELREELLRLVVHGVLHVLGYDHPAGAEREDSEMFRRQESILSRLI